MRATSTRSPWARFALWTGFLVWTSIIAVSSVWQHACGFSDWDLRASTLSCLLSKSRGRGPAPFPPSPSPPSPLLVDSPACGTVGPYCVSPEAMAYLAPRTLSDVVVAAGPAWVWVPVLLFLRAAGAGAASATSAAAPGVASTRASLVLAMAWHLLFIMAIRYIVWVSPGRWDPSGHVFMYGLQLVPLWLLPHNPPDLLLLRNGPLRAPPLPHPRVADGGGEGEGKGDGPDGAVATGPVRRGTGGAALSMRGGERRSSRSPSQPQTPQPSTMTMMMADAAPVPGLLSSSPPLYPEPVVAPPAAPPAVPLPPSALRWLALARLLEWGLLFMTGTTASFFHGPTETLSAWVLIAALMAISARRTAGETGVTLPPLPPTALVIGWWAVTAAGAAVLVFAYGVGSARALGLQVLFDLAVVAGLVSL
jgi:hypothetical protein